MTDLVIIGGGPAGLTAAIYASRAGLSVTVCEKNIYGGQTSIIDKIENYPGFKKINGMELASEMYAQAEDLGVNFIFDEVVKAELKESEKTITLKSGEEIKCKTVIIANGLKRRTLGCKGESEFLGKGVSYCATCDGSFFKSKKVLIIGGGNTALQDALYLSNICSQVYVIVRKNKLRGQDFLFKAIQKRPNIEIKFESKVKEIKGVKFVTSAVIESKENGEYEMPIDGVFIAIGYDPDCEIYKGQIEMDENGYFKATEDCETNLDGVFVAGDCRNKPLRQIVTATADGAVCGNKAAEYLLSR